MRTGWKRHLPTRFSGRRCLPGESKVKEGEMDNAEERLLDLKAERRVRKALAKLVRDREGANNSYRIAAR